MGKLVHLPLSERVEQIPDPAVDVAEAAVVSIEVARLRRALRTLPPLERRVVELRWGLAGNGEHSHRQVATRLGISVGRAWSLEQRALGLLRADYGLEAA